MRYHIIVLTLAIVIIAAGCVQQPVGPDNEITIPGHPTYTFSNPVSEAMQYKIFNQDQIYHGVRQSRNITIIFNGSSAKDNSYFTVVLYNIVTKLQTYFVYEGGLLNVNSYYFIENQWYNSSGTTTSPENITSLKLIIRGPETGATENSVRFYNNTIYIQGMTYKNLTLAGDRLILLMLQVNQTK